MAVYMKVPNLTGSVSAKGHDGWIAITTAHFIISRHVNNVVGTSETRQVGKPHVSQVTLTKHLDSSSNDLFQNSLSENIGQR